MSLTIAHVTGEAALGDVGRWIGARVSLDAAYISHGEIQQALSPDGKVWAADIVALLEHEARRSAASEGRVEVLEARDGAGARVGAATIVWELDEPTPHVILADLIVDPAARSLGVGKAIVAFVEAEAKARGVGWAFLESGLANHRAHDFFEREGFAVVSKVFAKRL